MGGRRRTDRPRDGPGPRGREGERDPTRGVSDSTGTSDGRVNREETLVCPVNSRN